MAKDFLDIMSNYFKEDTSKVTGFLAEHAGKKDAIITEAFKGSFTNKEMAKSKINADFAMELVLSESIDMDFLKANKQEILEAIDALDECTIKDYIKGKDCKQKDSVIVTEEDEKEEVPEGEESEEVTDEEVPEEEVVDDEEAEEASIKDNVEEALAKIDDDVDAAKEILTSIIDMLNADEENEPEEGSEEVEGEEEVSEEVPEEKEEKKEVEECVNTQNPKKGSTTQKPFAPKAVTESIAFIDSLMEDGKVETADDRVDGDDTEKEDEANEVDGEEKKEELDEGAMKKWIVTLVNGTSLVVTANEVHGEHGGEVISFGGHSVNVPSKIKAIALSTDEAVSESTDKKTVIVNVKKTDYDEYRVGVKINGKDDEDKANYVPIDDQVDGEVKGAIKHQIEWAKKNGYDVVVAASAKKWAGESVDEAASYDPTGNDDDIAVLDKDEDDADDEDNGIDVEMDSDNTPKLELSFDDLDKYLDDEYDDLDDIDGDDDLEVGDDAKDDADKDIDYDDFKDNMRSQSEHWKRMEAYDDADLYNKVGNSEFDDDDDELEDDEKTSELLLGDEDEEEKEVDEAVEGKYGIKVINDPNKEFNRLPSFGHSYVGMFTTGRKYKFDEPQKIYWVKTGEYSGNYYVAFYDASRGIPGFVELYGPPTPRDIMDAYDSNHYTDDHKGMEIASKFADYIRDKYESVNEAVEGEVEEEYTDKTTGNKIRVVKLKDGSKKTIVTDKDGKEVTTESVESKLSRIVDRYL